jgi:hypothetical protein
VVDRDALARVVERLAGDNLGKAASRIGCHHVTLGRLQRRTAVSISFQTYTRILGEVLHINDTELHQDFLDAMFLPGAVHQLVRYRQSVLRALASIPPEHIESLDQLESVYGDPSGVIGQFREWMRRRPIPFPEAEQLLAISQVLAPLLGANIGEFMGMSWEQFIQVNEDGSRDDRLLVNILEARIAAAKVMLQAWGSDEERVSRLHAAAESLEQLHPSGVTSGSSEQANVLHSGGATAEAAISFLSPESQDWSKPLEWMAHGRVRGCSTYPVTSDGMIVGVRSWSTTYPYDPIR